MDVIAYEGEAITWEGQNRHGENVRFLLWDGRTCVETWSIQ